MFWATAVTWFSWSTFTRSWRIGRSGVGFIFCRMCEGRVIPRRLTLSEKPTTLSLMGSSESVEVLKRVE